jgi:glutamate racemase
LNTKVAILDSGAGGLSILKEIKHRNLSCDCIYLADLKHLPYGELAEEQLIQRVDTLAARVIENYQPDIFILGCNTASTIALDHLRNRWPTPFIGVVPAIKPAAHQSTSKAIGVIATPATVKRRYLNNLIEEFAQGLEVKLLGSTELVDECEAFLRTGSVDQSRVDRELARLLENNHAIDTVVLACTHFAVLREKIAMSKYCRGVTLIDSTAAIVNRLTELKPELKSEFRPELKPEQALDREEVLDSAPTNTIFISTNHVRIDHYLPFVELRKSDSTTVINGFD